MSDDLVKRLREQAAQIAAEGIFGWGNLDTEAADLIERQDAEIAALKQDIERHIANHAADLNALANGDKS